MEEIKNGISRRTFLAGTGAAVGGLAAGSILGFTTLAEAAPAAGTYSWPASLTQNEVKHKAFGAYFTGGCMYGAAYGLIEQLKIEAGTDWDNIPLDMFRFGAGGAFGWGTLCGALNGSLFIINAVLNGHPTLGTKYSGAVDELMSWYQSSAFPVADSDLDSYLASNYTNYSGQNLSQISINSVMPYQTTCYSPLCHASVSTWCDASGKTVNGIEKKVRCARLTADVAAKAAAIINNIMSGGTPAGWTKTAVNNDCVDCHTGTGTTTPANGSVPKRDDEQGKMDCHMCHDDTKNAYESKNKAPACDRP